eukprot:10928319-Alexandrium_andersonii.AAC.1
MRPAPQSSVRLQDHLKEQTPKTPPRDRAANAAARARSCRALFMTTSGGPSQTASGSAPRAPTSK